MIGWWDDRLDYPGTDAVHVVTKTARLRWTLGVHPDREREIDTWAHWLGVTTTGPQRLLDLARRTTSGPSYPASSTPASSTPPPGNATQSASQPDAPGGPKTPASTPPSD